jgi:hypothetical protein
MQVGKDEIKLTFLIGDVIAYIENPRKSVTNKNS